MGKHFSTSQSSFDRRVYISLFICQIFFIAGMFSFIIWRKQSFKYGMILGVILGLGHALQTYGINFTDASKSGFITSLYIPFTPIISFLIEKEKPNLIQWICFPLSLLGSYMLFGGISGFNFGDF